MWSLERCTNSKNNSDSDARIRLVTMTEFGWRFWEMSGGRAGDGGDQQSNLALVSCETYIRAAVGSKSIKHSMYKFCNSPRQDFSIVKTHINIGYTKNIVLCFFRPDLSLFSGMTSIK